MPPRGNVKSRLVSVRDKVARRASPEPLGGGPRGMTLLARAKLEAVEDFAYSKVRMHSV